jgi:hypothetical protein
MKVAAILLMTLGLALANINDPEKVVQERNINVNGVIAGSPLNVTQCIYRPEDKILACRGTTGDVECESVFEWSGESDWKIFGLGFVPELLEAKNEQIKYFLFPRNLDNVTYVNHTVIVDGAERDLFLYYGEKRVEFGFRVVDPVCWSRIVSLIRVSSDGVNAMIGEVLLMDKQVAKRWLWGYGWGLGLGGWGYGGLGYGYPYGIWGR